MAGQDEGGDDVKTFKHSGDMGDVIYSLPAMRELGGGILYLDPEGGESSPLVGWPNHTRTKLNAGYIEAVRPMLEQQSYISEVRHWKGEQVDFDLDKFRPHTALHKNLADSHLEAFGLPLTVRDKEWMKVDPIPVAKYVISRSLRYHGNYGFWESLSPGIVNNAVFVGLPFEYEVFTHVFGHKKIEYCKTKTIIEAARVVAGVKEFDGGRFFVNQNMLCALGQAMHLPMTVEKYRINTNCKFLRKNTEYV